MSQSAASVAMDGVGWVDGWLAARHGNSLTYIRYAATWRRLKAYLSEKGIKDFAALTRQHCFDYYLWRVGIKRNTVGWELRVLAAICHEAVKRSIIGANPASALGVRRQTVKLKPELSPELMDEILALVEKMRRTPYKDFYRVSFLLGRYHGLRISETRFHLSCVNFATNTLTITTKGDKTHAVYLHPKVRPMLEEMANRGQAWTFAEPSDPQTMSDMWHAFFKRTGLRDRYPGICFHSQRVSVISQMARANISEIKAMRYVSHATASVHRIYARTRVADLADCCDAIG